MGLSITDAAALVTKGYKVSELKAVGTMIDNNPEEGNNIIELAKKLKYSDFEQAMTLFAKPGSDKTEDHKEDEPDKDNTDDQDESQDNDASGDDQGKEDDVDYKKLYEEEKSLRQNLQRQNQNKGKDTEDNKMSDWEIALQAASDILN